MAATWLKTAATTPQQPGYTQPVTFTSVDIGAAAADRIVVICVASADQSATSVTVGGVSATKAAGDIDNTQHASIWYAEVPTSTTANIVVGAASGFYEVMVTAGSLTGANTAPTDTDGFSRTSKSSYQLSCTIPTNGVMIETSTLYTAATSSTPDIGYLDYIIDGYQVLVSGYCTTAGDPTTVTWTPNTADMIAACAAVWEPTTVASGTHDPMWFDVR